MGDVTKDGTAVFATRVLFFFEDFRCDGSFCLSGSSPGLFDSWPKHINVSAFKSFDRCGERPVVAMNQTTNNIIWSSSHLQNPVSLPLSSVDPSDHLCVARGN